jgi:hypothetical protein
MKKISILLNVSLIAFIVFQACDPKIFPTTPNILKPSCPECASYNYSAGKESGPSTGQSHVAGLSISTVDVMAQGYIKNCQRILNPNPKSGNDARSIWFSVETLKEFIYNIEKASCEKKCIDKLELGVRIYYAQYPDASGLTKAENKTDLDILTTTKTDYQLNHTVFMVPTYDKSWKGDTKVHVDFDPWHMGDNCNAPISFDSLRKSSPTDQKALILSPEQPQYGRLNQNNLGTKKLVETSLLQNHGSIIPPDVNIGTAF